MEAYIQKIAVMAIPVMLAVVLHEVAHGYAALSRGDDTAKSMGRLSLNPLVHIDPFGTVLMPIMLYLTTGFLFAYAKPVPVNFMRLRHPKEDMVWVAAAGPLTNLGLALISALGIKVVLYMNPDFAQYLLTGDATQFMSSSVTASVLVPVLMMMFFSVQLNVVLAIINLIPVPPADGGRIAVGLLPREQAIAYSRIEPYGMIILIVLLFYNPLGFTDKVLWPIIRTILDFLMMI